MKTATINIFTKKNTIYFKYFLFSYTIYDDRYDHHFLGYQNKKSMIQTNELSHLLFYRKKINVILLSPHYRTSINVLEKKKCG